MIQLMKDELQDLFKCVRLTEMQHGDCPELDNLKYKIQRMIDTYCEHESGESFHEAFLWHVCSKCGAQYK